MLDTNNYRASKPLASFMNHHNHDKIVEMIIIDNNIGRVYEYIDCILRKNNIIKDNGMKTNALLRLDKLDVIFDLINIDNDGDVSITNGKLFDIGLCIFMGLYGSNMAIHKLHNIIYQNKALIGMHKSKILANAIYMVRKTSPNFNITFENLYSKIQGAFPLHDLDILVNVFAEVEVPNDNN